MFIIFVRTIAIYLCVVVAMRIMGKRQIGELQPSELVITMMISEVATIPLEDVSIPFIHGLVPVLTLIAAEILLSYLCLKKPKARNMFVGKPSIVIQKGVINEKELKKMRFNLEDMIEELRSNGFYNIYEIEYAVIETNGQLSIIPTPEYSPITKKDLNLHTQKSSIPFILVKDGDIIYSELERSQHDINWLNAQFSFRNISSVGDVFFASVDCEENVFIQKKARGK